MMKRYLRVGETKTHQTPSFSPSLPIPGAGKALLERGRNGGCTFQLNSSVAPMPTNRYDHSCGTVANPELGPEVVVAGGRRTEDGYLDTVDIYTVNTDSWRSGS